jgi:diaphanous 1
MIAAEAIESMSQKEEEITSLRAKVEELTSLMAAKPKFITEKEYKAQVAPPPPPPPPPPPSQGKAKA